MNERHFLDTILRPVTDFLEDAVDALVSGEAMVATAEPLARAIEKVPGAGRVAIFFAERADTEFSFLAGPSFSADQAKELTRVLTDPESAHNLRSDFEIEMSGDNGKLHRIRPFVLSVPGEKAKAVVLAVRDTAGADDDRVFDEFMDQMARIAGVVVEDRRLRGHIAGQDSLLEALIAAAPDAVIRIGRDGRIIDFTGRSEALFGYAASEVVGRNISCLMPEPHASRHDGYIEAFLATGERKLPDFGRRLQAVRKNGTLFPVEIALSQPKGPDQIEFIGIVRDITKREAREAELNRLRSAIEGAERRNALAELAGSIAHELNQPCTAIANYMDALEIHLESLPGDTSTVRDIARKAAGQARLGGEVIRRTKRLATRTETEIERADFFEAIREGLDVLSRSPSAADTVIDLGTEGEDGAADFDRIQIQQVLINLVTNALRATQDQDEKRVMVQANVEDGQICLCVSDNGPGVPDGDKPRLFDGFFTRSNGGMGLGLTTVKRIATAHGGSISVDDAPGGGARFVLTFPRWTASRRGTVA